MPANSIAQNRVFYAYWWVAIQYDSTTHIQAQPGQIRSISQSKGSLPIRPCFIKVNKVSAKARGEGSGIYSTRTILGYVELRRAFRSLWN
jgi:hypothetical protein